MKARVLLAPIILAVGLAPVALAEERVGIDVCDNFLDKYQTCVRERGGDQRADLEKMIVKLRGQWKELADNPNTKGKLEESCKHTIETVKPTLNAEPYKCGI